MLKKILHTGVGVQNLDESIKFFESLGFKLSNKFEKPEPKARVATVKNVDTAFELWQFLDKRHPQVKFIQNHIAIYSDDIEEDVNYLVTKGFKIVIPVTEGVVLRYAFVQDQTGSCYEIASEKKSNLENFL